MKLGLGTAQFGSDYGITNRTGQVQHAEIEDILALAASSGIRVLDTAALYGQSEVVLGQCLPARHSFRIVTKTPQFRQGQIGSKEAADLRRTFLASLEKLRQSSVYGLLVHHTPDLFVPGGERLVDELAALRGEGLVERIGASVYSPEAALSLYAPMDLVQLPFNLLDQRMSASGALSEMKRRGFEVHARSAFLQGTLLAPPEALPSSLERYRPVFERLRHAVVRQGLTPLEAAVRFAVQQEEIDTVVVGVVSAAGLAEILHALPTNLDFNYDFKNYASDDQGLINPACWVADRLPSNRKE